MILVDDAGSTYGGHMDHSPWNDMTFADFVRAKRESLCM